MYQSPAGENSKNVKLMVEVYDKDVNDTLPSVVMEYSITNIDYLGWVWIPSHTLETKGGGGKAIWKGLCLAKGITVKEEAVSDFFHFKQDLNRHKIYFQDSQSGNKFQSLMLTLDAYNAPISISRRIKRQNSLTYNFDRKKSTNVKKMKAGGYRSWWWRLQARWQRWCRS